MTVTIFSCSRKHSGPTCRACSNKPATKLCDFQLGGAKKGQTCDFDLCVGCAVKVVGDFEGKDYCPVHARLAPLHEWLAEQLESRGWGHNEFAGHMATDGSTASRLVRGIGWDAGRRERLALILAMPLDVVDVGLAAK